MSDSSSSLGGWLAGILATVIGAVIIFLLTSQGGPLNPFPTPTRAPALESTEPPASSDVICLISGHVYDQETNQPLSNVDVSYVRFTQDKNEYTHGILSHLATTAPDGYFEADCSWVELENFPLRLQLYRPGWHYTEQTNEYVELGETRKGLNFYVQDRFYHTPPP